MKLHKLLFLFSISIGFLSCEEKDDDILETQPVVKQSFIFQDGFETENNSVNELFPNNGSRWTSIQQANPTNATNEISISSNIVSEGQNALRLFAFQSDNELSKMDIEKSGFSAFASDNVTISADFYITNSTNIEDLLLIDLECCSCWDPDVSVENQCPGIRLQMSGGNDFLSIERSKIGENTLTQSTYQFPRNEWVSVEWELTLSDDNNGTNKLFINGTEIINQAGTNLPNAQTFSDIFAQQNIDFTLQQPVFYERLQIGATANPTTEDIELFVDNVFISVVKN